MNSNWYCVRSRRPTKHDGRVHSLSLMAIFQAVYTRMGLGLILVVVFRLGNGGSYFKRRKAVVSRQSVLQFRVAFWYQCWKWNFAVELTFDADVLFCFVNYFCCIPIQCVY